ncbi:CUB and sushi domain-containing protein 3 [Dorcoceras hygrometricum]|uniref:CUB and sushi domain-containing protein 3 n=1 Tax=Dorcoceras hygrometricum TaxID=472368 RepID=A0A2Z7C2K8_9LAMI|nr:CUB and sushi domain-containing protein 3 [Dorcoceras hygrometricum]
MKSGGVICLAVVIVAMSMFGIAMANRNLTGTAGNWNHTENYWGYWYKNVSQDSKRIVVGGSENWRFGFNYTDWAIKNGPFYLNDTLVFRYDPPNDTTFPHSVYLLPNFWSFRNCDLRRAKKIGEVTAGAGEGFEYVLKRWQPYYFACGERNGFHCNVGMMKFALWPLFRWHY